jgi:hypothetical protein
VSERSGFRKSIDASSAESLSSRLVACFWFGYFYFTYYLGIGPMLDAGEV